MEEQYENLLARQKARNTGPVKKALGNAVEKFGLGILDRLSGKALDKMFNKEDKFDIEKWKDADVNDMDVETIQKVSKWYAQAKSITNFRDDLKKKSSGKSGDS